jgi:hypothetical protein
MIAAAGTLVVGSVFAVVLLAYALAVETECTDGGTKVHIGDCDRRIGHPLRAGLAVEFFVLLVFAAGFYRAWRLRPGSRTAVLGFVVLLAVSLLVGSVAVRYAAPPR